MFDTDTTYPTDGVLITRSLGGQDASGRFDGFPYAIATAQAVDDGTVPLGRVHRTYQNGDGAFRLAERDNAYSYRYFRGAALNTPTPVGVPVMLLGPDADLPWLVGKVLSRDGTDRITVTPLWGPVGEALPPVATGDAWARIAAIPPATTLWHPDDDLAAAQVKQTARNTWLRWHVTWLALLGETVMRDWGATLQEICEEVDYTPPTITWQASTRIDYEVPLPHSLSADDRAYVRRALSLDEGAELPSTPMSAARLTESFDFPIEAAIPDPEEMPDLENAARTALAVKRPATTFISTHGVTMTPSYL